MRFARITFGLLLALSGLLAAIAGAVAAFWLVGPDNTITTPRRELASTGLAVVTAPSLLDRHGPTLRMSASGDKPLFIGVGQDLDVRDYLAGTAHTRLIQFEPPATFGTQELRGDTKKLTPPGELDWWVAQSAPGSQAVNWPMQDGLYDVVVMNADGTPAVGAQVSFGIEVHRLFGICLLVLGAGIVVLALGLALVLRRRSVVKEISDTTEIPVITNTRIPVLVTTAPVQRAEEENAPAYRVSPFAPDRVSPFAPVAAKKEQAVNETAPAAVTAAPAQVRPAPAPAPVKAPVRQVPVRPAPVRPAAAVPAAPMFMSPAAIARAKSPALIGAGASQRYDEPAQTTYAEPVDEPTESVAEETVPLAASPEFVKSDEAVRRTAALLASGAMLLTATSCGLMPPKNTMTAADSRPAVTLADAQAVVQRYNQLNNQANKTRDGKLAATIEGNPTLAQTQAGFLIGRKLDAAGKDVSKPFSYTDPEIGAPQFASYPMRFVVSSGVSDAPGNRQLGVWQRESAGSPWLLTHSVYPPKAVELPSVDGLRTPDADDLSKLQGRPEAVAKDLAAYLTGGKNAPQSQLFTPTPSLTKMLDLRAKSKAADTAEPYIADVTDTFAPSGVPLTFITESGDALVFLSLTERYLQRVEPGSNAYWTSGEATAFSSMVKYTQTLHQDYLHQVAVVIPAKSTGDAVQVLSIDPQLVGAGGA
ncbi:hypothetical protein EV137_3156 [Kribbella pratensis]|uniref:DUF8094 domain-containing protein n=1 Tax=Kribbella pratensis TaxID=2512112 RepID=A0ABY2FDC2_9ACTN|nr:hypothetical protein [Kribbella pratensis]TDW89362.1 hypothetical protein EV137_3156 [Kribbella pratensis]